MKINDIIKKTKNKELFPETKNEKRINQYENIDCKKDKNKIRAKTEKKKVNNNNVRHIHKRNYYNFKNNNDFINDGNSFLAFKKENIKNDSTLYQIVDIFNSNKKKIKIVII